MNDPHFRLLQRISGAVLVAGAAIGESKTPTWSNPDLATAPALVVIAGKFCTQQSCQLAQVLSLS